MKFAALLLGLGLSTAAFADPTDPIDPGQDTSINLTVTCPDGTVVLVGQDCPRPPTKGPVTEPTKPHIGWDEDPR